MKPFVGEQYCVLQEQDELCDEPRITAEETVRDGVKVVEVLQYQIRDDATWEHEAEIAECIALPVKAWETLVEMFALRYPDQAQRILTRAQGWLSKEKS